MKNKKTLNHCCVIRHQLELTFQTQEVKNSYQIGTFFTKLALDLFQKLKKYAKLCVLCANFFQNLHHFARQEKAIKKAKNLLTHQDLVEEMVKRVEKGEIPATEEL
jgi:hypothetical protein